MCDKIVFVFGSDFIISDIGQIPNLSSNLKIGAKYIEEVFSASILLEIYSYSSQGLINGPDFDISSKIVNLVFSYEKYDIIPFIYGGLGKGIYTFKPQNDYNQEKIITVYSYGAGLKYKFFNCSFRKIGPSAKFIQQNNFNPNPIEPAVIYYFGGSYEIALGVLFAIDLRGNWR